jgi:dienelactone hydrolase
VSAVVRALLACAAVLAGCTTVGPTSMSTPTPEGGSEQIPISVRLPGGKGPFPAVVIMHDCSGLGPRSSGSPERWANMLLQRGYAVVVPDSFSTRGFPAGVCTDPSPARLDVRPLRRVRDAYAALAHARTIPEIDGRRVGLMGGSHGGTTTLLADGASQGSGFAAAIAFYPGCFPRSAAYRVSAPLLILTGEKDDWTPAEPCRRLAETAAAAGEPVSIRIYPGAHHAFDSAAPVRYVETRMNASSPTGRGATTGGDPDAWADSIRQVESFFGRYLKPN